MRSRNPSRLSVTLLLVALVLGLASAQCADAYQEAGHFYSIYPATALVFNMAPDERRLLAFCAQLPDQSKDLDAVAVYKAVVVHPIDWARWGASDVADTDEVRNMVTVQQLIHALTGGHADNVQSMARAAVTKLVANVRNDEARRTNLCALGIGLHMFGDSYAHQRMADKPLLMYSTGMGHAADFSYPDYPLCDGYANSTHLFQTCNKVVTGECEAAGAKSTTRFCRWLQYPANGALLLSNPPKSQSGIGKDPGLVTLAKDFEAATANSNDRNHWGEDEVESHLVRDEGLPPEITMFFKGQASSNACQIVIDAALKDSQLKLTPDGAPAASQALSCAKIWNAYAPIIVSALVSSETNGGIVREALENAKWNDIYRCPLLDKHYKIESDVLCN